MGKPNACRHCGESMVWSWSFREDGSVVPGTGDFVCENRKCSGRV